MVKPVVGQKMYSLNVGNAARHADQKLTEVIVSRVGRKFFYASVDGLSGWTETKYYIGNLEQVTDYIPDSQLYLTRKEFDDEKESKELVSNISKYFSFNRLSSITIENLRLINGIINEQG